MPAEEPSKPIINIQGAKVVLGPLSRDLLPLYQRWMNDFEVVRGLGVALRPMTVESEAEWFDRMIKAEDQVIFTMYERSTLRPIGTVSLFDIDLLDRTAEYAILIGEKECWGKGYGTETTALMLAYGFSALNLHNIMLRVFSFNERGISAYERAGFRLMGRRREARRLGGEAYDTIWMDCLAGEFKNPLSSIKETGEGS